MSGKRMTKGMRCRRLIDFGLPYSAVHRALHLLPIVVMTPSRPRARIPRNPLCREDVLPRPLFRREGVLARQSVRQVDLAATLGQIALVQGAGDGKLRTQRRNQ